MSKSEMREVTPQQLSVDPRIQRPLDKGRVRREADRFNPDGLGVITVSDRGKAELVVLDGQHRMEIVRAAPDAGAYYPMKAEVFTGLTHEQEAALFLVRNNMARVSQLDRFLVRTTENDPDVLKIVEILARYGWGLGMGDMNYKMSAVARLEKVWNLDKRDQGSALERAVATATTAWGHVQGTGDGRVLEGLGLLFSRHGVKVDTEALIAKLAQYPGGPLALIGKARALASMIRVRVPNAIAEIVTEVYNKGRPATALPAWRS